MKEDRVIIVTTHSMLEADVLGDTVGIMANGTIECIGTPLSIKNQYGDGYTLSVVMKEDVHRTGTEMEHELTKGLLQSLDAVDRTNGGSESSGSGGGGGGAALRVSQRDGKVVKYTIPPEQVSRLSSMLRYLESVEGLLLAEWGVSDATLESAFLNVTEDSGFTYKENNNKKTKGYHSHETKEEHATSPTNDLEELSLDDEDEDDYHATDAASFSSVHALQNRSNWQPFCALLNKNFTLQSRQKCSSCCQVVTPILVMLLLTLLQAIIRTQIPPSQSITIPAIPYPLNAPSLASAITRGDHSHPHNAECLEFFFWTTPGTTGSASSEENNHQETTLLNNIHNLTTFVPQRNCSMGPPRSHHTIQVPYFEKRTNWSSIQAEIFQDMEILNSQPTSALENQHARFPNFLTPDGAVEFEQVNPINHTLAFTFSINDNNIALYHRPNGFTRLASKRKWWLFC